MDLSTDLEMDYIRYVNNLMSPNEVAAFNEKLNALLPENPPVELETDYIRCINNLMTPEEKMQLIEKLTVVPPEPPTLSDSSMAPGMPEPSRQPPLREFDVFLCYNHSDKPAVRKLAEELKARGIRPWLDEWELRPGLPWQEALEQQIGRIKSAAVFVGRDGIGPWQKQELAAFLREFINSRCPVIPVLLKDAPEEPALPIFLKGMQWVDFRNRDPDPMEQLVWGITGKRQSKVKNKSP